MKVPKYRPLATALIVFVLFLGVSRSVAAAGFGHVYSPTWMNRVVQSIEGFFGHLFSPDHQSPSAMRSQQTTQPQQGPDRNAPEDAEQPVIQKGNEQSAAPVTNITQVISQFGGGLTLVSPYGDLYPKDGLAPALGTALHPYSQLNMTNASIDSNGSLMLSGALTVTGFGSGIVHTDRQGHFATAAIDLGTSDLTGVLPVGGGGTGTTSLTANGVLYGNGTNGLTALTPGTTGSLLQSNGTGAPPSWVTASGLSAGNAASLLGGTWAAPGAIGSGTPNTGAFTTLTASGGVTLSSLTANGGVLFTNGSGMVTQTAAGTSGTVLHGGTLPVYGLLALGSEVSGTLPLQSGGTGATTPSTALANLGGEPAFAAGTTAQYLRGDKTFQPLTTAVVPEGNNLYYTQGRFDAAFSGKTTTNLTEGSNLYYSDARARSALSVSGPLTYNSGTGAFSLGTVGVGSGGTGTTSLTQDGLVYGNGSAALSALTPGTSGSVLQSNGTGAIPSWIATSGLTAGNVAYSGVTGGTNTSAAMLVGSGASLNFTGTGTINASSLLGGSWAAPGAMGATTPNTGAFTTLALAGNLAFPTDNTYDIGASGVNRPRNLYLAGNATVAGTLTGPLQDTGGQSYNVKAYGAKGDGTTDDTAAINAAINAIPAAGGGTLFLPQGTYKISSTITITKGVSIVGVGSFNNAVGGTYPPSHDPMSVIVWAGGAVPMIQYQGPIWGVHLESFALDARRVATYGITFDRLLMSTVRNVRITFGPVTGTSVGMLLTTTGGPNDNLMFNTFENLDIEQWVQPLRLDGTATANVCHNTFSNLYLDYYTDSTNTPGLYLGPSDNNVFTQTYLFGRGPNVATTYAVYSAGYEAVSGAQSNTFYHLEAPGKGVLIKRGSSMEIDHYDQENAEVAPTVEPYDSGSGQSSGTLFMTTNGINAYRAMTLPNGSGIGAYDTTNTAYNILSMQSDNGVRVGADTAVTGGSNTHLYSNGTLMMDLRSNLGVLMQSNLDFYPAATQDIGGGGYTPRDIFAGRNLSVNNNATIGGAISAGGALTWATDNTYDIGASGANRPRDAYIGRNLNVTNNIVSANNYGIVGTDTTDAAHVLLRLSNGNDVQIGLLDTVSAPGGWAGHVRFLGQGGVESFRLAQDDTVQFSQNLLAYADGGFDIGAPGKRPNNLTLKGNAIIGGNVGIGTTAPLTALDVVGSASLSANLSLRGAGIAHTVNVLDGGTFTIQRSGGGDTGLTSAFSVRNDGNVGIGQTNPTLGPLQMGSGAYVTSGGVWTNASDRNLKTNFTPLDPQAILSKIDTLPVTEWNYKREDAGIKHIGPVAQDFYSIFGVGNTNTSISTIDPAGIALLGIQALDQKYTQLSQQAPVGVAQPSSTGVSAQSVASLQTSLQSLADRVAALEKQQPAQSPMFSASLSASLQGVLLSDAKDATIAGTLAVQGRTLLNDLSVTGDITAGVLSIHGLDGTIDAIGNTLKLQSLGTGSIDLLAGKVTVDASGNVIAKGEITAKKINIDESDPANASSGKGILKVGSTTVTIKTTAVGARSHLFVTPRVKTNRVLGVSSESDGVSFTVEVVDAPASDVPFDWWIVN